MNQDVYVSPNVWKIYTISYMHYSTIGFLIGLAVGAIVSVLSSTRQNVDPRLLAPCIRKFLYTEYQENATSNGVENTGQRVWGSLQDTTL